MLRLLDASHLLNHLKTLVPVANEHVLQMNDGETTTTSSEQDFKRLGSAPVPAVA